MTLMTVSTLALTIHTHTIANATSEQLTQLSSRVDQLQMIQLSQASYAEQRLNTLSERLDTTINRLESRTNILEARLRIQCREDLRYPQRFQLASIPQNEQHKQGSPQENVRDCGQQ